MRTKLLWALLAGWTLPLYATQPGDTLEQVLAERGKPLSRADGGSTTILNYPDASIQLKDNQVVTIRTKGEAQGPVTHAVTPPPSARRTSGAATLNTAEDSGDWMTDYNAALAQAKEQNKQVFLFFTGSDWCGWCKRLNREILATDEFARYASDKLILVKLDFPRSIPQSANLKAQNRQLAKMYQIQGYPTVVVLSPSGKLTGQLGYQEGGPGPFVRALKKLEKQSSQL